MVTRTKSEKMAYFQVLARFEREIFIVCKIKPGMPGRPFGSGSISAVSDHPRGFARIVGRVLALGREKSRGVGRDRDCGVLLYTHAPLARRIIAACGQIHLRTPDP